MSSSVVEQLSKATLRALDASAEGTANLSAFTSVASKLNRKACHDADVREAFWAADGPAPAMLAALGVGFGFQFRPKEPLEGTATSPPLVAKTHAMLTAAVEGAERRRAESTAKGNTGKYWAAGVGYGHNDGDDDYDDWGSPNTSVQDSVRNAAVVEAQARLRKATEAVFRILVVMLETDKDGVAPPDTATATLTASPFPAVLKSLLREGDHLAGSNPTLFRNTVRCLRLFAHVPALTPLLDTADDKDSESLRALLKDLALDVETALELDATAVSGDAAGAGAPTEEDDATNPLAPHAEYIKWTYELVRATEAPAAEAATPVTDGADATAAPAVAPPAPVSVPVATTESESKGDDATPKPSTTDADAATTPVAKPSLHDLAPKYESLLAKSQFRAFDIMETGAPLHHYASTLGSDKGHKLPRVLRELRSMRRALPIHPGASIFVRYDKKRPMYLQALVAGPADTPYDSGLFLFDMYCPPTYPSTPPKVNLMTTGGGSVRFNPNLYNCGKVCLSLLGTWEGASAESWTVDSTLLQVFLSIQALIFVPEPYWNEPGVERSMHSDSSKESNRHSSNGGFEPLRHHSLKWAVADMIKNPPRGFEDVVKNHFKVKAPYIRAVMSEWLADATKTKDTLLSTMAEVETALASVEDKVDTPPSTMAGAGLPPAPELARATSA